MAEVLVRHSKLSATGVRARKARKTAAQDVRLETWASPDVSVTTVRRMTPEEIEAMVADYRAGIGSWRLAKRYGVSSTTVLERLKAAGVEIGPRTKEQSEQRAVAAEMQQLRAAGSTYREIGERFGVTRQTVAKRLWYLRSR